MFCLPEQTQQRRCMSRAHNHRAASVEQPNEKKRYKYFGQMTSA
jgi:hypothetical protein